MLSDTNNKLKEHLREEVFSNWDGTELRIVPQRYTAYFFITLHCVYCIDLIPCLNEIKDRYPNVDIVLLSSGSQEDHKEMVEYFQWDFPLIEMEKLEMHKHFDVTMQPYMIIVDADRIIHSSTVVYTTEDVLRMYEAHIK
ncbi:redoxin domain-containing protein [Paenibacillus sp. ACRSA]|uniref:peroxiredoxin family protein n=1 Tax=Paenibacillus sp. ACRSA TaxID=2918211 RepID=UPI001EF3F332|nr:thioredoxin-like domain-containing protein [Paenibacillus sp. ACRSA]MCG7379216.1 redoxin domain-containing protein [Paenibacillus sp. ACRSA]